MVKLRFETWQPDLFRTRLYCITIGCQYMLDTINMVILIFDLLSLKIFDQATWLAGSLFPEQGLNLCCALGSESAES